MQDSQAAERDFRSFRNREEIERLEHQALAPYATFSDDPRETDREHKKDPPDNYRTAFQRDWHRVTHCEAFRKLEFKTQVFVYPESAETVRNRLTHTLEATQIATSIARNLGLNEDLTRAITLAHDLGHPPFGHAGETELRRLVEAFNHNEHGYRVVTYYERRYTLFNGLNLTFATLEGMLKHETEYDKIDESVKRRLRALGSKPEQKPSLEAQAASISDQIAYRAHDIEDALESGLIREQDLDLTVDLCAKIADLGQKISERSPKLATITRFLIRTMTTDVIDHAKAVLQKYRRRSLQDVRECDELILTFSDEMKVKEKKFGEFLMEKFYRHPKILRSTRKGVTILRYLFEAYKNEKDIRPIEIKREIDAGLDASRAVAEYLAGLTDRSLIKAYKELSEFENL